MGNEIILLCFFKKKSYENCKAQLRVSLKFSLNLKLWRKKFCYCELCRLPCCNDSKVERTCRYIIFLKLFAAVSDLMRWKCVCWQSYEQVLWLLNPLWKFFLPRISQICFNYFEEKYFTSRIINKCHRACSYYFGGEVTGHFMW